MPLGQTITDLMMGIGIDVDSESFKNFGKEIDSVMGGVKEKAKSAVAGIGGAFKSSMPAIGGALKTVGVGAAVGFAVVGAGAVAVGNSIFDMASEAATAGDRIDKMSLSLGLSREGFQEWDYILKQNGASLDSMKTGMNKLGGAIDDVNNGNEKAAEKFARLGISMDDIKGKSREDIFEMTIAGLQGVTDENERAAIANDLLGKSAVDLAPLLAAGAEGTEELRKRAHDLGLVMTDEVVDASVKFGDTIDDLKGTIAGFKNRIAAEFMPGITQVAEGFTMLFQGDFKGGADKIGEGLDNLIKQAGETLGKGVKVLGKLVPILLPVLADAVINLVQTILDTITTNIGPIMETVLQVISMLAGFITENLPAVIKTGIEIIVALALGIADAIPELIPVIMESITTIIKTLVENLPLLLNTGIDILIALALGIANTIPELIPVIIEAIGTIVTTLLDNLPKLIEAAFQIIGALAFGLIDALPALIEKLPEIIMSITDFIANNLPEILKMGIEIIVAIGKGLIQALPQLLGSAGEIIGSLMYAFGGIIASVITIGADIVEGIWNGIMGAKDWFTGKVKGFFTGIVDGVKSLLGIHSPSRVFAGIGTNMAAGVGVGFDSTMDSVSKEMEKAIPTNFDISADISRTSKQTVMTAYEGTAEDTISGVKRQQERDTQKQGSKGSERPIILQIDKAFGDKASMRRLGIEFKALLAELGMETGDLELV